MARPLKICGGSGRRRIGPVPEYSQIRTTSRQGAYTVQFSTNLVDWFDLGPASPRYLFTDTNAPAVPQRYYRLRYP